MATLTRTLFRLAIATMALLTTGCGESPNETTWPHLLVSGTVSTVTGTPANGTTVRITTWASPSNCGDSVAISSVTATTTTAGAYQARVYTTIGPFTGCLRVEATTVHADTSLTAVPDGAQVKVNLRLP
jgi:hypothetical protein